MKNARRIAVAACIAAAAFSSAAHAAALRPAEYCYVACDHGIRGFRVEPDGKLVRMPGGVAGNAGHPLLVIGCLPKLRGGILYTYMAPHYDVTIVSAYRVAPNGVVSATPWSVVRLTGFDCSAVLDRRERTILGALGNRGTFAIKIAPDGRLGNPKILIPWSSGDAVCTVFQGTDYVYGYTSGSRPNRALLKQFKLDSHLRVRTGPAIRFGDLSFDCTLSLDAPLRLMFNLISIPNNNYYLSYRIARDGWLHRLSATGLGETSDSGAATMPTFLDHGRFAVDLIQYLTISPSVDSRFDLYSVHPDGRMVRLRKGVCSEFEGRFPCADPAGRFLYLYGADGLHCLRLVVRHGEVPNLKFVQTVNLPNVVIQPVFVTLNDR